MASATLIGDVVRSRDAPDRGLLHRRLSTVIAEINHSCQPTTPVRITVGDEYQGSFATVGKAARAALLIRLALLPDADVRHGLGWGAVSVLGEDPHVEDGPGWWAARDAIEVTEAVASRSATRVRRTAFRAATEESVADSGRSTGGSSQGGAGPDPAWVDAALMLSDALVGGLSDRSLTVLRGLLRHMSQREIADELDISPSAVSQRVRADGLGVVVAAYARLQDAS